LQSDKSTPELAARKASPASPAAPKQSSHVSGEVYTDFELPEAARAVAQRVSASKQIVPHYYLSVDLKLTKLLNLRSEINKSLMSGKDSQVSGISVLDFLVKASALAMKQVPDVNASWMETFVRRYDQVDINLIMGTGSCLATPVLKDVTAHGVSNLSKQIAAFEDTIFNEKGEMSEELTKTGTFSIHNLGMFGVKSAAPIILQPQACALSLGAIIDTVIPADESSVSSEDGGANWQVAPIMTATLSCDHRVVDGAVGAQWLSAFKSLVENPTSMML